MPYVFMFSFVCVPVSVCVACVPVCVYCTCVNVCILYACQCVSVWLTHVSVLQMYIHDC